MGVTHGEVDRKTDRQRNDSNLIVFHCVRTRLDKRGWIMESYSKAARHLGRFSSTGSKVPILGGKELEYIFIMGTISS